MKTWIAVCECCGRTAAEHCTIHLHEFTQSALCNKCIENPSVEFIAKRRSEITPYMVASDHGYARQVNTP